MEADTPRDKIGTLLFEKLSRDDCVGDVDFSDRSREPSFATLTVHVSFSPVRSKRRALSVEPVAPSIQPKISRDPVEFFALSSDTHVSDDEDVLKEPPMDVGVDIIGPLPDVAVFVLVPLFIVETAEKLANDLSISSS